VHESKLVTMLRAIAPFNTKVWGECGPRIFLYLTYVHTGGLSSRITVPCGLL